MKIHTEGCLDKFSEQIKGNIGGVGGAGIGIGLIQVIQNLVTSSVKEQKLRNQASLCSTKN